MSVKTEIERIERAKSDIRTAISDKGEIVPPSETVSTYADHIRNIPSGPVTGAVIDDGNVSDKKVWSSQKVSESLKGQFDDSVTSKEKGWHSRRIVDSLCLPFDRTGPLVTCNPVEGVGIGVTSEIAVRQERPGEQGTPEKPNKILPWNGAKLTIAGHNLICLSEFQFPSDGGVSCSVNGNTLRMQGRSKRDILVDLPLNIKSDSRLRIKAEVSGSTFVPAAPFVYIFNKNGFETNLTGAPVNTWVKPHNDLVKLQIGAVANKDIDCTIKLFLQLDERVSEEIECSVVNATFPEPVYGGKIDWCNSAFLEGFRLITLNGTENWDAGKCYDQIHYRNVLYSDAISGWEVQPTGYADVLIQNISNQYISVSGDDTYLRNKEGFSQAKDDHTVHFYDPLYSDGDIGKWKQHLADLYAAGKPVVLCLQVKRGSEKSIDITTSGTPTVLPGENNLYTDTGDTRVTGLEAPKVALPAFEAAMYEKMDEVDAKATYATMMMGG